ncbi:4-hydroxythreonine-4-phosphate dehydrogenase PdxA [Aliishimia ponticola]|uniref:4-hydroxythreonine-4-phosphate dehydrogenase n=1 Tax=Aliishimia ponticola TaxID=2499833 RepID=A0A4S4NJK8_9RHOB|nr:4-hydroxythreonine-4-phosphate dehydrogenase PdxA [Aliishimia ponticola]THH38441.1 4-hydroxythreonine-4-phosphate dehydrogenase PdxA [Aliishimia ponticola]
MSALPVAVTCGEPAGIGPEIAAAAWAELKGDVPMLWIGDPRHLPGGTPIAEIADPAEAVRVCDTALPVFPHRFAGPVTPGTPDLSLAQGVVDAIRIGVDLVRSGSASALCTAPIHKKVLQDGAGFAYPGHTEFLAHLGGDVDVVMMLASDQLRVVPATIHIALSDVPSALTPGRLRRVIETTATGLRERFGIAAPRLAVAGLNPHAGEGGAMGREELEWIGPMIDEIAQSGLDVSGPKSADTMFHAAARETYDAAICMYHDQALIPIKTLDFDRGVNVTLGLPFVRTSPDHGTAFDIAGKGIANPSSMIEALRMAAKMAAA